MDRTMGKNPVLSGIGLDSGEPNGRQLYSRHIGRLWVKLLDLRRMNARVS